MTCSNDRHGDNLTAYRAGCRCDGAATAGARSQKRYRLRAARGLRFHTDSTGTRRRIRALAANGWPAREIAVRIGTSAANVSQLGQRPTVFVSTARRIAEIYDDLAEQTGPSEIVAARAAKSGWLPPCWWDPDTIDDPHYQPPTDPTVHWTDVDPVAVERAKAGDAVRLTRAERILAVLELHQQGVNDVQIGGRLHLDPAQVWRDRTRHRERVAS